MSEYYFDFTLEQRRAFVLRHVLRLCQMQSPGDEEKYRHYVANSEETWINENFQRFAKNYHPTELVTIRATLASS